MDAASEPREFYVYHHVRTIDGTVFYVGKGKNRRMHLTNGRNARWKSAVAECGKWTPIKVRDGLTEAEAHEVEMQHIAALRPYLTNITAGGEGVSGLKFTEAQRKKLSDSHMGVQAGEKHPLYGTQRPVHVRERIREALKGNKNRGTRPLSDDARRRISEANKGKMTGAKHHAYDPVLRKFQHPDHGIEICTTYELRMKYDLEQGNISAVVRGVRSHHRHWRVIK